MKQAGWIMLQAGRYFKMDLSRARKKQHCHFKLNLLTSFLKVIYISLENFPLSQKLDVFFDDSK